MKETLPPKQLCVVIGWRRALVVALLVWWCVDAAFADGTGSLDSFIEPLKNGLNLIMVFGFIAGCVMVMTGFLNAKRDENWKMTVIYGLGVAGAVALMKSNTDSRPRAKSTGHAFGFEGNLGMLVIISGMISVFILTLLLNGENRMPLFAKFLLALLPTVLTTAYVVMGSMATEA